MPMFDEETVHPAVRTVAYWDEYAPWYRLWLEHTDYHHGIKDLLAGIVRPGWQVLDIGGGSGVLAIPLARLGCRITVVEPAEAMRAYLRDETVRTGATAVRVIPSSWEDVPVEGVAGFDLAVACNSLHLTRLGTRESLARILAARPARVLVVSELEIPFDPGGDGDPLYGLAGSGSFLAENSFRYHSTEEALRHLALKVRHGQDPPSEKDFLESLVREDGHYVRKRWAIVRWLHIRRADE
ncbi:MAG: class I SAM-dependent methyltransferase [Candidatus Moduliflexus flocculans]|nr:class I SAM-dependent methyltransferase [Candidatus Moduliflexus flocculans]